MNFTHDKNRHLRILHCEHHAAIHFIAQLTGEPRSNISEDLSEDAALRDRAAPRGQPCMLWHDEKNLTSQDGCHRAHHDLSHSVFVLFECQSWVAEESFVRICGA